MGVGMGVGRVVVLLCLMRSAAISHLCQPNFLKIIELT
jgi:hypothetical protein